MKILCTADVHIGRRPSRLPEKVDAATLSCARAWEALVQRAIAERVDLLLVAGDLVDQANRYYEAAGPVEAGVRALAAAGIPLVAVAGNHDHDSLPWLAERFPDEQFRLLGFGGRWERHTIMADDRPLLHVDGWSFPGPVVQSDPLEHYPRNSHDGVPVLGMLHADLDQAGSRHAPVSLAALRATPVDFWLLGHIHRSALHQQTGAPGVLYPGSAQAMDPGEPGLHGPWVVEIDEGGRFSARAMPISAVRYETVDVPMDGVSEEGEVRRRVIAAVQSAARDVEAEAGPLRYLSLRLRLTGRTPLHGWLQAYDWSEVGEMDVRQGEITPVVEWVRPRTRPALDLEALARGHDAPALLARLITGIERDTLQPHETELLRSARTRVDEVERLPRYVGLMVDGYSEEGVREALRDRALELLDTLLVEREAV